MDAGSYIQDEVGEGNRDVTPAVLLPHEVVIRPAGRGNYRGNYLRGEASEQGASRGTIAKTV